MRQSLAKQGGFSLVELLVSLGVFSIVAAATATLIWSIQSRSIKTQNALSAETEAEYFFRSLSGTTRLAAKVASTPLNPSTTNYTTGVGSFRHNFNYRRLSHSPPNVVQPLAVFLREHAVSNANSTVPRSRWRATGLFFLPPTAQTPGVVYLTLGTQENGQTTLTPSASDLTFSGVTEVFFENPVSQNGRLVSVDLNIVYRIPLVSNQSGGLSWCPARDIADNRTGCESPAPYKDISRKLKLLFSNNRLNHVIPSANYLKGAYYFRPNNF